MLVSHRRCNLAISGQPRPIKVPRGSQANAGDTSQQGRPWHQRTLPSRSWRADEVPIRTLHASGAALRFWCGSRRRQGGSRQLLVIRTLWVEVLAKRSVRCPRTGHHIAGPRAFHLEGDEISPVWVARARGRLASWLQPRPRSIGALATIQLMWASLKPRFRFAGGVHQRVMSFPPSPQPVGKWAL